MPLLSVPYEDWYCPNGCYAADRHAPLPPGATRYHPCPRLHGLNAPLVRVGSDCTVEAVEREDYLNGDGQAMGDDGKVTWLLPRGTQTAVSRWRLTPGSLTGK